jgi:YbgC/YbaW family acyl-CoA thioester hydrolase
MKQFLYGRHLHHYETDADGVCHFSNYLRIFEEAFGSALRQTVKDIQLQLAHSFAVTEVQGSYQNPMRYGDEFSAKLQFNIVRRSFFVAEATISVGALICAVVSAKLAAISIEDNRSVPLDEKLRHYLSQA